MLRACRSSCFVGLGLFLSYANFHPGETALLLVVLGPLMFSQQSYHWTLLLELNDVQESLHALLIDCLLDLFDEHKPAGFSVLGQYFTFEIHI